ncbi:MAG: T9SS type A sorting domain-containing protein [Paludibacteraceae bacterium]|nr:T9SS type A sorting domain-containing protein [Paludibacteraceae bacterium]
MKNIYSIILCLVAGVATVFAQQQQVWDLGAEQFEGVQNMLSEAEINSWFDAEPGTTGLTISDVKASDSCNFLFNGAGKSNHRLRTENANLSCYDRKSLKDADGNVYKGYIYSNAGSNKDVYIEQTFEAGDKIEYYVGSNGGTETYVFQSPSGKQEEQVFTNKAKIEKLTFYAGETGKYRIFGTDEKLVVARIVRTPAKLGGFNGKVTAPKSIPDNYQLVFTNLSNGAVASVAPNLDQYEITGLALNYAYEISLANANGYVVSSENPVLLKEEKQALDIEIKSVDLVELSGKIVGLSPEALAVLEFEVVKPEGKIYEPEYTIDIQTGDYKFVLENGVEYGLIARNVNDYSLTTTSLKIQETTKDYLIVFEQKPLWKVTINPTGATLADLANAEFNFVNLEDEYAYSFVGTDAIALRDGVYSVKVKNSGIYTQLLTSNLRVEGADVVKTIDFTSDVTAWNFADDDFINGGFTNKSETYNYNSLVFTGGQNNKTYLLLSNGAVVKIPVKGNCIVTINACYEYHLSIGETVLADDKTGSTSQIDKFEYNYIAGEGYVELSATGTTYLTSIAINKVLPYKETITVGADKDYPTINDALAAVRQMVRQNNERVTIMIDPGNYEEMLKIDVNNVTFRNAAATPSIAIKNAGVDIDENAVRITSYYGTGYNYASMGTDFFWNARTLQVNKENGYVSTVNQGGSSATYWNSTVIVSGKDFEAYDIIFENSFNQYISKKESEDVVYEAEGISKGARPTDEGNTKVQERSFRERACAIAFTKNSDRAYLENCRVIGRQDAFYGDQGARIAVKGGVLMGAVDYIFGGMTLACKETELSMLVTDDKNDATYYTAAKQDAGVRGYLFHTCHVVSAMPEVEMAETAYAKPGYWGRPWSANAEAVFYNTIVDSCLNAAYPNTSLINAAGWNNGLTSTGSPRSCEYGTQECVDNSANRVSWSVVLEQPVLADGTAITLYNFTKGNDGWNPFNEVVDAVAVTFEELDVTIYAADNALRIGNIAEPTQCMIFDMSGRQVLNTIISTDSSIELSKGVYLVQMQVGNKVKRAKVII